MKNWKLGKRILAASLAGLLCLGSLTGCGGGEEAKGDGEKKVQIKAAIVVSGGFGTQSFSDVALAGCQKAADEFGFELNKIEKVSAADAANTARSLISQRINVIIFPADTYQDTIKELAPEYPDVYFVSPDCAISDLEMWRPPFTGSRRRPSCWAPWGAS